MEWGCTRRESLGYLVSSLHPVYLLWSCSEFSIVIRCHEIRNRSCAVVTNDILLKRGSSPVINGGTNRQTKSLNVCYKIATLRNIKGRLDIVQLAYFSADMPIVRCLFKF